MPREFMEINWNLRNRPRKHDLLHLKSLRNQGESSSKSPHLAESNNTPTTCGMKKHGANFPRKSRKNSYSEQSPTHVSFMFSFWEQETSGGLPLNPVLNTISPPVPQFPVTPTSPRREERSASLPGPGPKSLCRRSTIISGPCRTSPRTGPAAPSIRSRPTCNPGRHDTPIPTELTKDALIRGTLPH